MHSMAYQLRSRETNKVIKARAPVARSSPCSLTTQLRNRASRFWYVARTTIVVAHVMGSSEGFDEAAHVRSGLDVRLCDAVGPSAMSESRGKKVYEGKARFRGARQAGRSGGGSDRQGLPNGTYSDGESDGAKSMRGLELRGYGMD